MRVCIFIFRVWYSSQFIFAYTQIISRESRFFIFQCCLTNYHRLSYLAPIYYLTVSIGRKSTHDWIELSTQGLTRLKARCHLSNLLFWSSWSSFKFKLFLEDSHLFNHSPAVCWTGTTFSSNRPPAVLSHLPPTQAISTANVWLQKWPTWSNQAQWDHLLWLNQSPQDHRSDISILTGSARTQEDGVIQGLYNREQESWGAS